MQEVGVKVEESTSAPGTKIAMPFEDAMLDDPGFVDFVVAGTELEGEFRCTDCGYGAVVHRAVPPCPMCGGTIWESRGPLAARSVG